MTDRISLDITPTAGGDGFVLSLGGLYVSPERLPDRLVTYEGESPLPQAAYVLEDDLETAMNFINPERAAADLQASGAGLAPRALAA